MYRIYVSPYRSQRTGQWSKRRILWATFRDRMDANLFLDRMRMESPDWIVETKGW